MNQLDKKDNADLDKIDRDINFHRIMVFLILVTAIIFYMIFINLEVTESAQSWGPVGDFFGGILNPIFALFAFYWLTYSVRLQIKELKETREELGRATKAQEESAKHQEEIARLESENVKTQVEILDLNKDTLKSQQDAAIAQQQQIALQNFESLFFQLLKAKTDITNDIRYEKNSISLENSYIVSGKEAIKNGMESFKNSKALLFWDDFYRDNLLDYMGSYFLICYQILKLIDSNEELKNIGGKEKNKHYSTKQKEYFDIFRATLTQYELEVFFYNCLSNNGNYLFKDLIENYGLFDHISIENNIYDKKSINKFSRCIYFYDAGAFEGNVFVKEYFLDLIKIKKGLNSESLKDLIEKLVKYKFVEKFNQAIGLNPNGKGFVDYSQFRINSLIKWRINESIFTSENINLILDESISYTKINNEIEEERKKRALYKNRIKDVYEFFDKRGESPNLDEKVDLGFIDDYSINELEKIINDCESFTYSRSVYLHEIDECLKDLKQNEYTETVLTIIKYNIDYFQYWDYMDWKEKNQQKKSA